MTTTTTTAKLFLTDYASYNNGTQFEFGHWVDLTDFSDAAEFLEYCDKHFKDSGIEDAEIVFTDYEGFPERFYGESMSETDLNKLFEALPLIEAIENADDSELVSLHNAACRVLNCLDDEIFSFDEDFFEIYFSNEPMKAAQAASFGNVNWSDDWITFDGYANLKSISSVFNEIDVNRIYEAYESDPREFGL